MKHASDSIVVIGDWVVNEYWILADHPSPISAHNGRFHFRLANKVSDDFRELGGAGLVARVLVDGSSFTSGVGHARHVTGLGRWHKDDAELVKHLLHDFEVGASTGGGALCSVSKPRGSIAVVPTAHEPTSEGRLALISLDDGAETIRVVRQYRRGKKGLALLQRIDHESESNEPIGTSSRSLPLLPTSPAVGAIVLFDLKKRNDTMAKARELAKANPSLPIFVRSKWESLDWVNKLANPRELVMIGPETVGKRSPFGGVVAEDGRLSRAGWDILIEAPAATIRLILAEGRQCVAVFSRGGNQYEHFTARGLVSKDPISDVGWSTTVFALLVRARIANLLGARDTPVAAGPMPAGGPSSTADRPPEETLLKDALLAADRICANWSGSRVAQSEDEGERSDRLTGFKRLKWQDEERSWTMALSPEGRGIISDIDFNERRPHLDLWRATSELPGYVSLMTRRRSAILTLSTGIAEFSHHAGGNPRSLAIKLTADPGAGKTFLAETLAKASGLEFLECDISQFASRSELVEFFDRLSAAQVEHGERVLVFVDEINAGIDSRPVYGAFLAPLEKGVYLRRQLAVPLKPCVWLFAGTDGARRSDAVTVENLGSLKAPDVRLSGGAESKFADFESRLSHRVDLSFEALRHDQPKEEMETARLEHVYLGAAMILKYCPHVRWVDRAILNWFFAQDPSTNPARRIREICLGFKSARYEHVSVDDLPPGFAQDSDDTRARERILLRR